MRFETKKPDREWMKRLRERGFTADTKHPDDDLKHKLLSYGGYAVVLLGDNDKAEIIAGQIWRGHDAKMVSGARSDCHANASRLFMADPEHVQIGTGYALSQDGCWRQHSWGFFKGHIVETTAPRVAYFGYLLSGNEARAFARAQGVG